MRRTVLFWLGVLLLVGELASAALLARAGMQLLGTARTLQAEARAGAAALLPAAGRAPDVGALADARQHFARAEAAATTLLRALPFGEAVFRPALLDPAVRAERTQATAALTAARDGSRLAATLADSGATLTRSVAASAGVAEILRAVQTATPGLQTAQLLAADVGRELAVLRKGQLSARTHAAIGPLEQKLPMLQEALQLAQLAPAALGGDGDRSYLLVAQNPSDLRPTGGFMGSWGVLTLRDGAVAHLTYGGYQSWEDVRDPARGWPMQAAPVQRYLHYCCMAMQDANWFPDFPTTARVLEQFAAADQPLPISGVIAVDPAVVQALLRVTGPVDVPSLKVVASADNFVTLANYFDGRGATKPPESAGPDKEFLIEVAQALAARLVQPGHLSLASLAQSLPTLLADKHVLVALDDPDLAAAVAAQGWDGAIQTPAGDYLMLDDMSMSDNKVDNDVERQIDDRVQLTPDGGADVTLAVTWANHYPSPVDPGAGSGADIPATTAFRDFYRLYLPPGAANIQVDGGDEVWPVSTESGHTVAAGFVVVERGTPRRVVFRYHVPAAVVASGGRAVYALHVQRQAGIAPPAFRVQVTGADGAPLLQDSVTLERDHAWQVAAPIAPPPAPPVPAWNRACVARHFVAGLRGPYSGRAEAPSACG